MSYEPIAEKAFGSLKMDRYLLEFDTDRAGGFEPLRFVPKGKTVVLGLITTKEPTLESEDELVRRIEQAAKYVPMENLALSTQCGFASAASGNLISWDDMRRKLELVARVALGVGIDRPFKKFKHTVGGRPRRVAPYVEFAVGSRVSRIAGQ